MNQLFRLDGQTAVITGGASGIGLATAHLFAQAGANVVIFDRDGQGAQAAAASLPRAQAFTVDVADEGSVQAGLVAAAGLGCPSVLVNCAGMAIRKDAVDLPLADWDQVVRVNLTGSFIVSRLVARLMMAAGRGGAIVHAASIMGLSGGGIYPNVSYHATKGAVVNMTRALAIEWAPHQIRVNAVAPTWVRTPFIQGLLDKPEVLAQIAEKTPLGRMAEPQEVAAAILFLSSAGATMITGHCLPVDGGFLAQ